MSNINGFLHLSLAITYLLGIVLVSLSSSLSGSLSYCDNGLRELITNIVYSYQSSSNASDFCTVFVLLLRTTFFTVGFTQVNVTILMKCVPARLGLVDVLFGGGMFSLFLGAVLTTSGVWLLPVWAGL